MCNRGWALLCECRTPHDSRKAFLSPRITTSPPLSDQDINAALHLAGISSIRLLIIENISFSTQDLSNALRMRSRDRRSYVVNVDASLSEDGSCAPAVRVFFRVL